MTYPEQLELAEEKSLLLVCSTNQMTVFYMIATLVFNELNRTSTFNFFEWCLLQISLDPFLNTL